MIISFKLQSDFFHFNPYKELVGFPTFLSVDAYCIEILFEMEAF